MTPPPYKKRPEMMATGPMPAALSQGIWDAVVVGAGPAGCMAAALLAERGRRVLLVDAARFPREKTCGGCLNATAVALLRQAGLQEAFVGAPALEWFSLNIRGRQIALPLAPGRVVSRAAFDAAMAAQVVRRGGVFVSGISATLLAGTAGTFRELVLRHQPFEQRVRARTILACDGLGGRLLEDEPGGSWWVARRAWLGISATLADEAEGGNADGPVSGTIHMSVSRGGYVGRVRMADGRTHWAAAVDPEACRTAGGVTQVVATILAECGEGKPEELAQGGWKGIGNLTRQRRVLGGYRVLAAGDACGYVEPFTGEGMAWALASGQAAAAWLLEVKGGWAQELVQAWTHRQQAVMHRQQRYCRVLRRVLRWPGAAGAGVGLGAFFPTLAGRLAQRISRPREGSWRPGWGALG